MAKPYKSNTYLLEVSIKIKIKVQNLIVSKMSVFILTFLVYIIIMYFMETKENTPSKGCICYSTKNKGSSIYSKSIESVFSFLTLI